MDIIIFLCFIVFMAYLFIRIRNGMFEDKSRRKLHIAELLILLGVMISMFPDFYHKISADLSSGRFSSDSAMRSLMYLLAIIVLVEGYIKLIKNKDD